ncbi:MAG TPA: adenylate/guanylate cyclase domain-containing protein [Alphaproteobacteria bacterium]
MAARILVVDDEPDVELLLNQRFRRNIRSGEFAFRYARDGEQALKILEGDPGIDLILLDINMPVMDGLTMLARLRENQSPVKAIIVSAYGDMTNIRTAMNRGAFDFVTKPIDMADLDTTIAKTLAEIKKLRDMDRQRVAAERARNNLARYFSPGVVEVLADRDQPFGPVRRQNVAVLFVDIVGFTGISETMAPEAVVDLLRQFAERMSAQVFACGGTMDKLIGDAMLATFGVPTAGERDAQNALQCADMMITAMEGWNTERAAAGQAHLAIGIGLNYGLAVIGDVGSEQCMSFTVVGDTVNTASRLQGLTRSLKARLLAADAVIAAARLGALGGAAGILERLLDGGEQMIPGRSRPVRVWLDARPG